LATVGKGQKPEGVSEMENLNVIYRTARIDARGNEWVVVRDWTFFDGIMAGTYSHKEKRFFWRWFFCDEIHDEPETDAIEYAEKRSIESL
jgi:hypothetical protein